MPNKIAVGTRTSPLAIAQAELVIEALKAADPTGEYPIHGMTTTADHDQKTALYKFGGKGLWVEQLEDKLVEKELDIIVHSLKDVPTTLREGCVLGCIMGKSDRRDVLIIDAKLRKSHGYNNLDDLPAGSVVGTSSLRRIAQIARRYPSLKFKDVRGNIQTRLRKLDEDPELSAIVIAAAGLLRMDLGHHISQYLDRESSGVMHAVGQGALGVECRAGDERVLSALAAIGDKDMTLLCLTERSLLRTLEGGCSVPIGVETKWATDGKMHLHATVVAANGSEGVDAEFLEEVATEKQAEELGKRAAKELAGRGGQKILDEIIAARPVEAK